MHALRYLILLIFTSISGSGCSSLFYQPTHYFYISPEKVGLEAPEDIYLRSDRRKLHGWFFEHTTEGASKGMIVFFHGNAQNLTSHFMGLRWIVDQGYDYFIFDYAGYGKSEGASSQANSIQDGVSAVCWAAGRRAHGTPLIIYGQSLGGAVAMRTAHEVRERVPIDAVAVDSTFYSYRAEARSLLSKHWLSWWLQPLTYLVVSDAYSPEESVSKLSPIPFLVIHGDRDRVVDYSLGQKLFELAQEPKEFVHVEGGGHIDAFFRGDRYQKLFLSFLERNSIHPRALTPDGELYCNQSLAGVPFEEVARDQRKLAH